MTAARAPLQRKKLLPGFRERGGLDLTRDPSFELRTEDRARSVNHDHVFGTFRANSMRHARRNYGGDVVPASMIVTINKETHDAPRKSGTDIAQNHLRTSLQEKHYIPLFVIITTQGVILRLAYEQASQPFLRSHTGRNRGRMHMKSFCAMCKHARGRPLLRPKPNLPQNSVLTPHKFTENSAVMLRMDCARKNFHAWNPNAFHFRFGSIRRGKFSSIDTGARHP